MARVAAAESGLNDQLSYAREFAKRHHLTVVRGGLRAFSRAHTRSRATPDAAPNGPEVKPGP
jgi:hypothetical protein